VSVRCTAANALAVVCEGSIVRIAMLSVHSSPLARLGGKEAGGMNVYVRELARELGARGVPVDIFTRRQDRQSPTIQPLSCGVRVIQLHAGPAAPYDKNHVLTYLPEFVNRIRCFAEGEDLTYDMLHSHYWLSGEAALRLRPIWRVPVVHMFHTLAAMKNAVARSTEEVETQRRVAVEQRLLREADAVVAATTMDKAQMVWNYSAETDRIRVIPCGVDQRRFQPLPRAEARRTLGLEPDATVLLAVGRMEPLKGFDALIRAAARLVAATPALRSTLRVLLIGGDREDEPALWNNEQQRLDGLRRELGVAEQVVFLGAQPQELLPQFYSAADVVAAPSHYESFGLAVLEAMACGAAVVASNVGGLALTIEDGRSGLLSPVDDAAALAAQLQRVLTDAELAARLRSGAVRRSSDYAWPTVTRRVLSLYTELHSLQAQSWARRRALERVS
jgi:D-inositol-3-phosphate glycosyltransferase